MAIAVAVERDGGEALRDVGLPLREGLVEVDVAVHAPEEGLRAQGQEAVFEVAAELTEVFVMAVAEGEHGEVEVVEAREGRVGEAVVEGLDVVGRVAVAICAGDDEGYLLLGEGLCGVGVERERLDLVPLAFQLLGDFF